MKQLVCLLLALAPAAAHADKAITGGGTHDCKKDPVVMINDGEGTYKLVGTCDRVLINGGENKVTIESAKKVIVNGASNRVDVDAADKISVAGNDNVVNYKKGVSGGKPTVGDVGTNNKINQVK